MARVVTKIGDVFSAAVTEDAKKYFQLVAFDLTQLNSDVIRAFKTSYPLDAEPDLHDVVRGEVDFHVHCVTKWGVQMGLWHKVGKVADVGDTASILFRSTLDHLLKDGESPIQIAHNWRVWHVNDKHFTEVKKLRGKNRKAEVGFVVTPAGVIELLRGNDYFADYPSFE